MKRSCNVYSVPEGVPEDVGDLVSVHDAGPGRPGGVHRPVSEVVHVHTETAGMDSRRHL